MKWLSDILKDGTLKDNQFYLAKDAKLSNYRFNESIDLNKRGRGKKNSRNNLEAVWAFLNSEVNILNEILKNKNFQRKLVLITEGDYEHNTEDPFAIISGVDAMNFSLQTGNVIGLIKKGDYTLMIKSRFGDKFLKYIISDADGFLEIEDFGGKDQTQSYEWLILYLWKIKLIKAFRLGLPKTYITKVEISNKVRGLIDVQDYFLHPNTGKYNCTYREHSFNIEANQLISAVFRKHRHNTILQDLLMIRNAFEIATEGVRPTKFSLFKTPYFSNPFYTSYNTIIDLSKQILKDDLADFGESSNINAYLFDVSMLFEYFVRKLLRDNGLELNDKFFERLTIPTGSIENYKRKLEPDIVFESDNKKYVFDVKYKSYDFKYGAKRKDLFQLHTYVGQYTNKKEKVEACGFIYPLSEKKWDEKVKDKNGFIKDEITFSGNKITFCIGFIKIPSDCESIDGKTFKERFKENCNFFVDNFVKIIKLQQ